jgi:hypothetical protein
VGLDLMRVLNPLDEIVGRVRELSRDVVTLANAIQRRTDQTSRTGYATNRVASVAAVLANLNSSNASVTASSKPAGLRHLFVAQLITSCAG